MTWWQQLIYDMALALVPVLASALIALIGAGFAYLRARYKWMQESRAVQQAESTLYALVQEANQRAVEQAKAAREDGKLTKQEADEIKRKVAEAFKATLTEEQKKVLKAITDDISIWISAKIEEMVVRAKLEAGRGPFSSKEIPPKGI